MHRIALLFIVLATLVSGCHQPAEKASYVDSSEPLGPAALGLDLSLPYAVPSEPALPPDEPENPRYDIPPDCEFPSRVIGYGQEPLLPFECGSAQIEPGTPVPTPVSPIPPSWGDPNEEPVIFECLPEESPLQSISYCGCCLLEGK